MNAIIFHPSQELALIKEQKRLILYLNKKGSCFFPSYPLFCFLHTSGLACIELPELKKQIKEVRIEKAEIRNDRLVFPVKIILKDGKTAEEEIIAGTAENKTENKKKTGQPPSDFYAVCRIFRAAHIEKKGFSTEIWNDIWIKLQEDRR